MSRKSLADPAGFLSHGIEFFALTLISVLCRIFAEAEIEVVIRFLSHAANQTRLAYLHTVADFDP